MQAVSLSSDQATELNWLVMRYLARAEGIEGDSGQIEAAGHQLLAAAKVSKLVEQQGGQVDDEVLAALREHRAYLACCVSEAKEAYEEHDGRRLAVTDGILAALEPIGGQA